MGKLTKSKERVMGKATAMGGVTCDQPKFCLENDPHTKSKYNEFHLYDQKQHSWETLHSSYEINQRLSNEDINSIYRIGKEIGVGRFGIVRLAARVSHPSKRFAIKCIPRDIIKTDIHLLEQEISILRSADHPNVI
mmetsp:Transcript_5108/g.4670  ORF Transcript_5108/g.4670 Transcript_5108/m.4670 type:complete len:136 (-) Transcript_5108:1275-1682(-)